MKRQHLNMRSVTSHCNGHTIRGSIDAVMRKHEALGYEAESAGDMGTAHNHFQHADHYKRVLKGENQ